MYEKKSFYFHLSMKWHHNWGHHSQIFIHQREANLRILNSTQNSVLRRWSSSHTNSYQIKKINLNAASSDEKRRRNNNIYRSQKTSLSPPVHLKIKFTAERICFHFSWWTTEREIPGGSEWISFEFHQQELQDVHVEETDGAGMSHAIWAILLKYGNCVTFVTVYASGRTIQHADIWFFI